MTTTFTVHETATAVTRNAVIYHETEVFRAHNDGSFTLDTGGWFTVTTKKRMNQALNHFGGSLCRVYQKAGDWFVRTPSGDIPFRGDSITIGDDGKEVAK